ncbi:nickel-binding protein [Sinorhizobium fredii]|uniref:nickel-binding protein n=1 Tax=Rhizobium fredii TaxID=380 RepID=UPI0033961D0B
MPVFAVERDLKGITMDQLADAQRRAIASSKKFSQPGKDVRYIRSTFIPGEERSMCLFEAPDASTVEDVNRDAAIPYKRVIEALDLTP